MTHPSVIRPADHAVYSPHKMGKATLFESSRLLVGLNAFEPGQQHALHAHAGQDKAYLIVEGSGEFLLDGRERADARRGSAGRARRCAARRAEHRLGTPARAGDSGARACTTLRNSVCARTRGGPALDYYLNEWRSPRRSAPCRDASILRERQGPGLPPSRSEISRWRRRRSRAKPVPPGMKARD